MMPARLRTLAASLLIPTLCTWSVACRTFHVKDSIEECEPGKILVTTKGGNQYVFEGWVLTSKGEVLGNGTWHRDGYPSDRTISFIHRILPSDSIVSAYAYEFDLPRTAWFFVGLGLLYYVVFCIEWKPSFRPWGGTIELRSLVKEVDDQ